MINIIPEMVDSRGSYWDQPKTDDIELSDTVAYMTKSTFDALKNYESSYPTGVYEGKMWRRGSYLCWYHGSRDPLKCDIGYRAIQIVSELPSKSNKALRSAVAPAFVLWNYAETISNIPSVDEAVKTLLEDNTGDNATALIVEILERTTVFVDADEIRTRTELLKERLSGVYGASAISRSDVEWLIDTVTKFLPKTAEKKAPPACCYCNDEICDGDGSCWVF